MNIDINDVPALTEIKMTEHLNLGGNVTLNNLMNACQKYSNKPGFGYLQKLHDHIDLVAHVAVRNVRTNLSNLLFEFIVYRFRKMYHVRRLER